MQKTRYIIIMLLFATSLSAQTMDEVGLISKFGLAGGFTPIWFSPGVNAINEELIALGIPAFSESGIITYGGGGYAYIMFFDNVRIGGIGFSGSSSREAFVNGKNREARYSIGGGALSIEYTFPFIKNIAVSIGVLVGRGAFEIDIYQNSDSVSWDDVWTEFSGPTENISRKISNNYFIFAPTVNVDIPLNRFIALRLGTGYQFTFANKWEVDNEQTLQNVPAGLNGDSFFIQTGLFIGFFAF